MKVIASDFDGTICINGGVSERNIAAIRQWQAAGNHFGLVTGRDVLQCRNAQTFMPGVRLDFLICCSGALILDNHGRKLWERTMSASRLEELSNCILDHNGLWLSYSMDDTSIGLPIGNDSVFAPGDVSPFGIRFVTFRDFVAPKEFQILRTGFSTREQAQERAEEINTMFRGYAHAWQNHVCLDITADSGTGKAQALEELVHLYGIDRSELIPIGDEQNDLEMITAFGGCTVENAAPAVKRAAREIYPDVAALIHAELPKEMTDPLEKTGKM